MLRIPPTHPFKVKRVFWILLVTVILLMAIYSDPRELLDHSLDWISGLGAWGPIAFICIYILATVLSIPGSILTLGTGALFGVVRGSIFVSMASTVGALIAFLIGRYLARQWVSKKIKSNPHFAAVDEAVGQEGWKIVGLLRLSPIFPFNLLNYAMGITKISLRDYVLASWIGMMPGTVMYVYIGSLVGDLTALGATRSHNPSEWFLYIVGLAATVTVTLFVTRLARRILKEKVS